MSDPLRILWDALEAQGCRPHGKPYEFRARCPAHDGDNPSSLSVGVGADGRALLNCFAHGCEAEAITAAVDLSVADLFPDGHYRGRRHPLRPVRRSDFDGSALTVANVLHALEQLGEDWTLMLASDCPYCGSPGAWLRADRGHVVPTARKGATRTTTCKACSDVWATRSRRRERALVRAVRVTQGVHGRGFCFHPLGGTG